MTGTKNALLVDTGADISVFKRTKVHLDQIINCSNQIKIKGVTNEIANSLGTTKTNILIDQFSLNHEFHIVNHDFPIPCDGILGRDFLIKYHSIIDYSQWIMTVKLQNFEIHVPISSSLEDNIIHIPPRCEVNRHIDQLKNLKTDAVVVNKEIYPGVFIARTIVSKENPLIKVINTTSDSLHIKLPLVETISLHEFDIYKIELETKDRHSQLMSEINQDVPDFVKADLFDLCREYSDVFALKTDRLSVNNFYTQNLKLCNNKPVYIKNYRTPRLLKEEIHKQVQEMLRNDIIEPSVSEYNSPVLLVPKKSTNGKKAWRLCIDFRCVNKVLVADKFPLPRIDDILDQLGRAKWFSVVDLMSGFHQIPLNETSRDITSFSVDSGSFRFTRLPFGLSVSPNSFQRMMSLAFAGITPEKAFLYMDDLIVIGCSEKHHLKNLRDVFSTCRKYCLKLNPQKCNFFRKEVTFLGHKITDKGILPDESKYEIINNYPIPLTADDVKRFVAFCNYYRRFIPNFATITYPLNKLTRKNATFHWSEECQNSFILLKKALISPNILQYPDFSKEFILVTDASNVACGAVLCQNFNGIELPIAYASRTFTKGESHKPTILKELTAIHWAIRYFRCYLYGQKFLVKSDHRPLVYLFSMKDPNSKLTRMRLDLEEFNFDIEYIKGKDNVTADALSRVSIDSLKDIHEHANSIYAITRSMTKKPNHDNIKTQSNDEANSKLKVFEAINNVDALKLPELKFEIHPNYIRILIIQRRKVSAQSKLLITKDNFALEQILSQLEKMAGDCKFSKIKLFMKDKIFSQCTVNEFKEKGNNIMKQLTILLCNSPEIITSNAKKDELIEKFHNDPLYGGHCGQKRLLKKLKSSYTWKHMSRDVANFCKKCHKCQVNKATARHMEPFVLTPTPQKAFDIVCIDTIGPFQKSNLGNVYAVTIQCELTKYVVIQPIPNKEASTVAKAIFENFILIYGPMREIRTDLGTEYKNELFQNISKLLNISHNMSTAYHSQTIGGCERNHRVLNEFMRMYVNESGTDWDVWTRFFSFCYNTTPSTYHNYTPFELVFGRKVNIPENLTGSCVDPLYNIDAYDQEIRYRLQSAHKRAKEYLEKAKRSRKILCDRKSKDLLIKSGDLVLITNEGRQKLDSWFSGPYTVVKVNGVNCNIKDDRGRQMTVHKNRIKPYIMS